MRKLKLLTSSLLVASCTQLISLVGCDKHEIDKYYNVSISHDDGVESITETKIFGQDITIKCVFTNPFWCIDQDDGKTTVKVNGDEIEGWSVVDDDTIVIPHNKIWTTKTKIEVDIKSRALTYDVNVQKDDHISNYEISKTFLNDIVITCSFDSAYVLNADNISVKVDVNQEEYENWEIDETGKQLTITKDDSWTAQTPINISLVSDEVDKIFISNLQEEYTGTVGEESSSEPITIIGHAKSSNLEYDVTSDASVEVDGEIPDVYYDDNTHKICWTKYINKDTYDFDATADYYGVDSEKQSFKLNIQSREAYLYAVYVPDFVDVDWGRKEGVAPAMVFYCPPDSVMDVNISRFDDLTISISHKGTMNRCEYEIREGTDLDNKLYIDYKIELKPAPGLMPPYHRGYMYIDFKYLGLSCQKEIEFIPNP